MNNIVVALKIVVAEVSFIRVVVIIRNQYFAMVSTYYIRTVLYRTVLRLLQQGQLNVANIRGHNRRVVQVHPYYP